MELFPLDHSNSLNQNDGFAPLAEQIRPTVLNQFVGQNHLIDPGKPLHQMIQTGKLVSMLFWGPTGSGKTTLARLMATLCQIHFIEYSAVLSGIKQIREVVKEAKIRIQTQHCQTILFVDEIHRFNKAQQDAFLPHVENGTIILIGATTENPSFEVIPALMSRCHLFQLKPLAIPDILTILGRGFTRLNENNKAKTIDDDAMNFLADYAGGDARVALNGLETAFNLCGEESHRHIDLELISQTLQKKPAPYDKRGEHHYNFISVLHKSIRGSDPNAALYWLSRMIDGGEDPFYILRRLIRIASEDIGLADPQAITLAISARDAYQFLGSPEGDLALAQCVVYLATAPKSNRLYTAFKTARETAQNTTDLDVPIEFRNAPTHLMKKMGYGREYRYDHDFSHAFAGQFFLPKSIKHMQFYTPTHHGFEQIIKKRIEWWQNHRQSIDDSEITDK